MRPFGEAMAVAVLAALSGCSSRSLDACGSGCAVALPDLATPADVGRAPATPDPPPPDLATPAALPLAACIVGTACGALEGGLSECSALLPYYKNPDFANELPLPKRVFDCLAAAGTSCAQARACVSGGATGSCSGQSSCSGSVLEGCAAGGFVTRLDCAELGQSCVEGTPAACGYGSCSDGDPYRCVGDQVEYCYAGVSVRVDCRGFDAVCDVSAASGCRGNSTACTANEMAIRCDGESVVWCLGGREARYDCRLEGRRCLRGAEQADFGCAKATDCDPYAFSSTCSSSVLKFCDDGSIATLDCRALGFSGCDPSLGRCLP